MKRQYFQMSGGAFASKLLGGLREILLARFFGTGPVTDAYRASLTATLFPMHLLAGQVVESCFIPLYTRYLEERPRHAWALFHSLLLVFIGLGVLLAAALFFLAEPLVGAFLPGFDPARQTLTVRMLRLMSLGVPPYIYTVLLTCLGAAYRDFRIPSLRPGLQNLGMLIMILVAAFLDRPELAAIGFSATYLLLALLATFLLQRRNEMPPAWSFQRELLGPLGRALWQLARPLLPVSLLLQSALLVERHLASRVGGGTIAAIDYARFLTETSHVLLIIPLGLISLTAFVNLDAQELRRRSDHLLALVFLAFVPLSAFLLVNGRELLAVLFLRGQFDAGSLQASAAALVGLSAGLWAYCASHFLRRVLNARMENGVVLRVEAAAFVLNVGFCILFFRPLGILALGLGPSIGALGSLILYVHAFRLHARQAVRVGVGLLALLPVYLFVAWQGRGLVHGLGGLLLQVCFAGLFWTGWALAYPPTRRLILERWRKSR